MENGNGPEIPDDPGIVIDPEIVVHPVIFFIDRLRLVAELEDVDINDEVELHFYFASLVFEYYMSLVSIFNRRLNAAGRVNSIYVNFGHPNLGCCRINPRHATFRSINVHGFTFMLASYVAFGMVLASDGMHIWRRVDRDTPTILDSFPDNFHVIGCVSGEGFPDAPYYLPYIQNLPEQPLVFVIGTAAVLEQHIDIIVRVADHPLLADNIAFLICNALEQKWNIN